MATNAALALLRRHLRLESRGSPDVHAARCALITSTLQQSASTRLGFTVKKTMTLAQRLYEAGHITYMRTDSTNLPRRPSKPVAA